MAINFELRAEVRTDAGKGASRRLRREGKVPAILYGAGEAPQMLTLEHNPLVHSLENEAFYSHVLSVNVGGKTVRAVLKDLQRHPYRALIMHMDLQRVSETEKLHMRVPLHFKGEDVAPGVKLGGGIVVHMITEVEVSCLPKDLPEFLEVDISNLQVNDTLHLTNIALPRGVEIVELAHGADHDQPVVSIHLPRAAVEAENAPEATPEAGGTGGGEGA